MQVLPKKDSFPRWVAVVAILWMAVLAAPFARANEIRATAKLSASAAAVGETLRLDISITGANPASPPEVRVPGLEIANAGYNRSIQMTSRTGVTVMFTYHYSVIPQKEGEFTSPALTVVAGGHEVKTEPLVLSVSGQASAATPRGTRRGARRAQPAHPEPEERRVQQKIAFAEWVLPKTSVYVVETVPAEVRVYLATNIRWSPPNLIHTGGEGFSVERFPVDNKVAQVKRDGEEYHLIVVKLALTPAKTGQLSLDAAEFAANAQLPRSRGQRPQLPGFEDFFDDPFFNRTFMVEEQVAIRSEPVVVEVKPLPTKGKPPGFSGAIGQFKLETRATPATVQVGDPVTLTAEVSGMGNFQRMGPPTVAETPGWKAYPPSSNFEPGADTGISGVKRFEYALIPDRPQTALPEVTFSYFDPSSETYQTLTGKPLAINVEGSAAPAAAPPTPAAATAAGPTPSATPGPNPVDDILPIRADAGRSGLSFTPLWEQPAFRLAQAVPLAALLLLVGWQIRRLRSGDTALRRLADLRRRKQEAARTLADPAATPEAFYTAAIRHLQLDTALRATGPQATRDAAALDAEAVCASRRLEPAVAAAVRSLFAAHDELRYAGSGSSGDLSTERREAVQRTLKEFEQSHA